LATTYVNARRNLALTAAVCTANTVVNRTNVSHCTATTTCVCVAGTGLVGTGTTLTC
jgi:hypothetical protein